MRHPRPGMGEWLNPTHSSFQLHAPQEHHRNRAPAPEERNVYRTVLPACLKLRRSDMVAWLLGDNGRPMA